MAGVSLILNPSMNKNVMKDSCGMKDDWVKSSFKFFVFVFSFYKDNVKPSTILVLLDEVNFRFKKKE
jgi:hypothetical protein